MLTELSGEENVHSSVTCQAFPCMDNTCIKHHTEEEGNIRKSVSQGQGGGSREWPKDVGEDREQEQEGDAGSSGEVQVLGSRRQQWPWARAELIPVSSFYDFMSALKNVIRKIPTMTIISVARNNFNIKLH